MSRLATAASARFLARLVAMLGLAATLFLAGTLGSSALAQDRGLVPTVIVACDHGTRTPLATRMSGVETAGRIPDNVAAALQVGTSCAEVFNALSLGGFDLVHRLPRTADDDFCCRDFMIWQRNLGQAPARRSRVTTVLLGCDYVVADTLVTRVAGSEIAGAIDASLAALLATRPSCAGAYAALAGAGFGLVSAAPAPAAGGVVDASDLGVFRNSFGATP